MKALIDKIVKKDLGEEVRSISEILTFGSVNNVYNVTTERGSYIIRINDAENKRLEFLKEEWCINAVTKIGIPSPCIIKNEIIDGYPYMIQEKIEGVNGSTCSKEVQLKIYNFLGECARKFNTIPDIDLPELKEAEFHENWQSKLDYNIQQLTASDSLLSNGIFNFNEHQKLKAALTSLKNMNFTMGLVHGDLSPRNVIANGTEFYLLDWGTASVDIVPYNEIGILLIEGEADEAALNAFLNGMGISGNAYHEMELLIRKSNILHRLDKYRWAVTFDTEHLKRYTDKLRKEYLAMVALG